MKGSILAEQIDTEYRIRQIYKEKQKEHSIQNEHTKKEKTKQS